jgi:hypothetical protein
MAITFCGPESSSLPCLEPTLAVSIQKLERTVSVPGVTAAKTENIRLAFDQGKRQVEPTGFNSKSVSVVTCG